MKLHMSLKYVRHAIAIDRIPVRLPLGRSTRVEIRIRHTRLQDANVRRQARIERKSQPLNRYGGRGNKVEYLRARMYSSIRTPRSCNMNFLAHKLLNGLFDSVLNRVALQLRLKTEITGPFIAYGHDQVSQVDHPKATKAVSASAGSHSYKAHAVWFG